MGTQLPQEGHSPLTQFSAHVYCVQMVGWNKMPLVTEADLGPDHIVLDGDPAAPVKEAQQPLPSFRPLSIVAMVAHLSLLLSSCYGRSME